MTDEKIDHHFNELSPVDFNIFIDTPLYKKLHKEELKYETVKSLLNHIIVIKEQIESLLNQEDEQLTVVYGFLTNDQQENYLKFLIKIEEDTHKFLSDKKEKTK